LYASSDGSFVLKSLVKDVDFWGLDAAYCAGVWLLRRALSSESLDSREDELRLLDGLEPVLVERVRMMCFSASGSLVWLRTVLILGKSISGATTGCVLTLWGRDQQFMA
jgi:hypothetical protein